MSEVGVSAISVAVPTARAAVGADMRDVAAEATGGGHVATVNQVPEPKVDPEEMQRRLQEAVRELNRSMDNASRSLAFSVDQSVGVSIVTVTNKDTGEVVRQIPGEAMLNIAHSIESLKGILYNATI